MGEFMEILLLDPINCIKLETMVVVRSSILTFELHHRPNEITYMQFKSINHGKIFN